MILALVAVAHLAQADDAGHVLQFAMSIGGARQAIERVIGNVQFHHAAAHIGELLVLGGDLHPGGDRGGTRGRQSLHALDLDQAQAAGAEGLELVGGAQLGDLHVRQGCGTHHRGAFRHRDFLAVDGQRHRLRAVALGGAEIPFNNGLHGKASLTNRGRPSVPGSRCDKIFVKVVQRGQYRVRRQAAQCAQ